MAKVSSWLKTTARENSLDYCKSCALMGQETINPTNAKHTAPSPHQATSNNNRALGLVQPSNPIIAPYAIGMPKEFIDHLCCGTTVVLIQLVKQDNGKAACVKAKEAIR